MGLLGVSYAETRIPWIPRPYSSTVFPVTLGEQLCSQNGCFLGIFVCIQTEQAPLPCNSSKGCHSQLTPFFFCGKRFVRGIGAVKTNHGNQWSQRVHSKVPKFFFPDKIRRKQKLLIYFYQRVIDRFPCCTAEDTGHVITSWKLLRAPVSCHTSSWSLYEMQPVPVRVLHDAGSSSQVSDPWMVQPAVVFSLFKHARDSNMWASAFL